MKIEINNAQESITKMVKAQGNTGRVYLPKSWIGKEVQIVLLEGEKMEEKKYSLTFGEIKIIAKTDEEDNIVFLEENGEWTERVTQLQAGWSFQDEKTQENWDKFIGLLKDISESENNLVDYVAIAPTEILGVRIEEI